MRSTGMSSLISLAVAVRACSLICTMQLLYIRKLLIFRVIGRLQVIRKWAYNVGIGNWNAAIPVVIGFKRMYTCA